MTNQIKMAHRETIYSLFERGWSQRRIATELGLNRETVSRHLRLRGDGDSKPAISPPGKSGRQSACRGYEETIQASLEKELSAQRIYQDLRYAHGFQGSYDSVKRYVRAHGGRVGPRVYRVECEPGQEAQVDFGAGAWIVSEGRRRRSWVLRVVLSHSRKGYSEAVFQQTTGDFIWALENAFWHFGGVPLTLITDNLKAVVKHAEWFDPELTPKVAAFCKHYGTVILPTRVRTPRHNGKVERGVGYVKGNALKGRHFETLGAENAYLSWWEEHVADQRIHGTTRRHVGQCFHEAEQGKLQPLPKGIFPCFEEGQRTVHRDSYVEVKQAYYEVPEEYIGRQVWVRYDSRLVRVFNLRWELLATHTRQEPGRFSTSKATLKRTRAPRNLAYWIDRVERLGAGCRDWARQIQAQRGVLAIRVLMGLSQMAKQVGAARLNQACITALELGYWRLRDLRRLLAEQPQPSQLSFLESHPVIRDLKEYGKLVSPLRESQAHEPTSELPTAAAPGFERPSAATMDNSCPPAPNNHKTKETVDYE